VSVNCDGTVGHVVKAIEQSRHGGLARSGATDDRHRLSGREVGVEVAKNLGTVVVGEVHVIEIDRATYVKEVVGARALHDLWILVEDFEDSPGAGLGALSHHDELAEHHERCLEHQEIQTEGEDLGIDQVSVQNHPTTTKQYQGESQLGRFWTQGDQIARMFASLM